MILSPGQPTYWNHVLYICFLGYLIIPRIKSETVFMDKWGHCEGDDIDINGDIYTIQATGGGFNYETLNCDITFKAKHDKGLCLTFKQFYINDCKVVLKIYERSTSSGSNLNMLKCHDSKPPRICTRERYMTIKLEKSNTNYNKNYHFEIDVQESDTISGEGVLFMSVGLIAGIICAVILVIALMASLIMCCCCKKKKNKAARYTAARTCVQGPPPVHPPVRPSAPPPDDGPGPYLGTNANPECGPYLPPLYQPPAYSQHDPYAVNHYYKT